MLEYTSLLTRKDFTQVDASMSYPLSGLYNFFLIKEIGIDAYLKMYRNYSGTAEDVDSMMIRIEDLPLKTRWQQFIDRYSEEKMIGFDVDESKGLLIYTDPTTRIYENDERYYFVMKDTLLIPTRDTCIYYRSRKFEEVLGKKEYQGEKYLVLASSSEISIYNLYTNNLIANCVCSFSIPPQSVPEYDGSYRFHVRKNIFENELVCRWRNTFRNSKLGNGSSSCKVP